ncbi:unnamed protein product [Rangifer tarandus platyrhynchus]|uniref:Uncharacterized protein n=2 Tax=Rangifer tarandus platyrhynchus TaxID=3082113 RepID=A0ACB0DXY0_RANTA|nr:unnamed protein product [Rangifer tarandus platyrhynchus]CAI9693197.1 unnamed protein product [Rangifer tarandus platyrhynchus]
MRLHHGSLATLERQRLPPTRESSSTPGPRRPAEDFSLSSDAEPEGSLRGRGLSSRNVASKRRPRERPGRDGGSAAAWWSRTF